MVEPFINVTLPVFNEEAQIAASTKRLHRFLSQSDLGLFEVVISDNGSTDRTWALACELAREYESVRAVRLEEKGRGRAIKAVWSKSEADILSYMDVDLSTNLEAFPGLIAPLRTGAFDIAVGSRLLPQSHVKRGWKREMISRCYNMLPKLLFQTRFSDAQCGFKAITRRAADDLLHLIEDNGWFFDTELLVLGERLGYRIFDLPVRWVDDPDSRVKIFKTAVEDVKGLIRLSRNFALARYSTRHRPSQPATHGRNSIDSSRVNR